MEPWNGSPTENSAEKPQSPKEAEELVVNANIRRSSQVKRHTANCTVHAVT